MRFAFRHRPLVVGAALLATVALAPLAAQNAQERVDYDAIYRIKDEGFSRSQIMNTHELADRRLRAHELPGVSKIR